MKRLFKKHLFYVLYLSCLVILRQLLLVVAQQMNAEMFNQLVFKNISAFIWVIVFMSLIWIFIIALDSITKIKKR